MSTITNMLDHPLVIKQEQPSNIYTYYGFSINVVTLTLKTSVTLRVTISYLVNDTIVPTKRHDATYSFMNRFVTLSGDDYAQWGADDSYIYNYVTNNLESIINSTETRPMLPFHQMPMFNRQRFQNKLF